MLLFYKSTTFSPSVPRMAARFFRRPYVREHSEPYSPPWYIRHSNEMFYCMECDFCFGCLSKFQHHYAVITDKATVMAK